MIYLNRDFTNAGLISCTELNKFDIKIKEKINIDIIKEIFYNYRILGPKFGNDRAKGLKFNLTIINIYKHKDGLFKQQ